MSDTAELLKPADITSVTRRRQLLHNVGCALLTAAIVGLACVWLYLRNRRFFYGDDMQHGVIPAAAAYGEELKNGNWPARLSNSWMDSYVIGNPQAGLFNPVSLLSYIFVAGKENLLRTAMILSTAYLMFTAVGAYVLARLFSIRKSLAVLAGVAISLQPFLIYWGTGSWHPVVTSQCWFVWLMVALMVTIGNVRWVPLLAVAIYLTLTAGFPQGVLASAVAAGTMLFVAVWYKQLRGQHLMVLLLGSAAGVAGGSLPWIIGSDYVSRTERISGWWSHGFLSLDLSDLLGTFSPFGWVTTRTFPAFTTFSHPGVTTTARDVVLGHPIVFSTLLIVPALMLWSRNRLQLKPPTLLLGPLVVMILLTLSPEQTGPIRWPVRYLPYMTTFIVLLAVYLLSQALRHPPRFTFTRKYLTTCCALVVLLVVIEFSARPLISTIAVTLLTLVVGAGVVYVVGTQSGQRALAVVMLVGFAAVAISLRSDTPQLPDYGAPGTRSEILQLTQPIEGYRTLMLIRGTEFPPGKPTAAQIPSGNITLLNNRVEIINSYSALVLAGLNHRLCTGAYGWIRCDHIIRELQKIDPVTGEPYLDLFGVDQVYVQNIDAWSVVGEELGADWGLISQTKDALIYRRTTVLSQTNGVAGVSGEVNVSFNDNRVVVNAGSNGTVVFSQPWSPSLRVTVGGKGVPVVMHDGIFAAAQVTDGDYGEIRLTAELPRKGLMRLVAAIAVLLLAASWLLSRRIQLNRANY